MAEPIVSVAIPQGHSGYKRHLCPTVSGTRWVDGVQGCLEADFTVHDPAAGAVLTQDCQVVISDPDSGDVLWTGAVARNGVERSPLGDSAVVRCVGNTDDVYNTRHWSLPYIVRDYAEWQRETIKYASSIHWGTDASTRPVTPLLDALVIRIDRGKPCRPGYGGRMAYEGHMGTDMWIGAVTMMVDHGTGQHPQVSLGAPSKLRTHIELGDIFYGNDFTFDWTTTTGEMTRRRGGGYWPVAPSPITTPPRDVANDNYLVFSTEFTDTAGYDVTNENVWAAAHDVVVAGSRVDEFGNVLLLTTQDGMTIRQSVGAVRAGEIVKDLVGRCLRGVVDPTRIDVRMDTWRLTAADWREPTTPGEVMDDLMLPHPEHLWRLGRRDVTTGLASLEWRLWDDTAPRYMVDGSRATLDLDGSPDQLYNSVTVRWIDWRQRPRSDTFTADPNVYPDIADLQGIREAPVIDLAASLGQWATVTRIGERMLDQVARHVPAGTVTVTEPVLDLRTQQLVPPSHIEAGSTLAITTDEPMVVHRVQEVEHDGTDVADITVGRPRLTLDQIVATRGRRRR